jgi:hypothetical protein
MGEEQELEKLINKRQKVQEEFSKGAAKVGLAPTPKKQPTLPGLEVKPEPVKKVKKGWW